MNMKFLLSIPKTLKIYNEPTSKIMPYFIILHT